MAPKKFLKWNLTKELKENDHFMVNFTKELKENDHFMVIFL